MHKELNKKHLSDAIYLNLLQYITTSRHNVKYYLEKNVSLYAHLQQNTSIQIVLLFKKYFYFFNVLQYGMLSI